MLALLGAFEPLRLLVNNKPMSMVLTTQCTCFGRALDHYLHTRPIPLR